MSFLSLEIFEFLHFIMSFSDPPWHLNLMILPKFWRFINFDTIFIFSYPPTMNLIAIFTKKILKKNTIYSVWELYPEIANKLNELNYNFLHRIFKWIDNYCLKTSTYKTKYHHFILCQIIFV